MRLVNLNLKGLLLYPTPVKVVYPANHKYGASATWSHCNDTASTGRNSFVAGEINAFKYNLRCTVFDDPFYSSIPEAERLKAFKTGCLGFGVYFPTDRWRDPNVSESESDIFIKYPIIPDYYETEWTQAGVNAGFVGADQIGVAKSARYPNHGQQMFDLTYGLYGYDVTNSVAGTTDVTTPLIEFVIDWFRNLYDRYPAIASYRNGQTGIGYKLIEYFIGIRGSAYDYRSTYGYSQKDAVYLGTPDLITYNQDYTKIMKLCTRQLDMSVDLDISRADALTLCQTKLQDAIDNGGWYTDFTHWNNGSEGVGIDDYFASQASQIGSQNVITLGMNTALEHVFMRKMIRRVGLFTHGDGLSIVVDIKDSDSLPKNPFETSLSIDVDLTGTVLEGKEISSVTALGIRKLAANHFIVEVPYNNVDGFKSVLLEEAAVPAYSDFTLPVIMTATKSGNTLTVITDKPCNVAIFTVATGGALYDALLVKRSNIMSKSHLIDVTGITLTGKDTYIGIITEEKQSILSAKYNF